LLLGEAASVLTAWQQAIVAAVFELCLVGVMVGYELLGHTRQPGEEWLGEVRHETREVSEALGHDTGPAMSGLTLALKSRLRPMSATAKGSVESFMRDQVFTAEGEQTEIKTLMQGYRAWRTKHGLTPIALTEFLDKIERICRKLGIKIEVGSDRRVYCLNVKLRSAQRLAEAVH
jgi:hypothetical protein